MKKIYLLVLVLVLLGSTALLAGGSDEEAAAKQLGEETAVIEQVQIGAIEFTRVSVSPMAAFYKPFDALQMPYLYRGADHMWTVLNGPIGERFLKSVEAANFVGL